MVEDLFQLSRATVAARCGWTLVPLALGEVVSDAVAAEAAAAAAARASRWSPTTRTGWPTVAGSDTELTRVVRNLLSNAMRHTPAGGPVALSAGTSADGDGLAARSQDACGGIPEADLDRIFDVGYRGSRRPHARRPDPGPGSAWPSPAPWPRPTAAGSPS